MRERLDPGDQSIAALDFLHNSQKPVTDFIRRLEKVFQTAFGRENLSVETRDVLLYGQLQKGLSYALMKSPSAWFPELQRIVHSRKERREKVSRAEEKGAIFKQW